LRKGKPEVERLSNWPLVGSEGTYDVVGGCTYVGDVDDVGVDIDVVEAVSTGADTTARVFEPISIPESSGSAVASANVDRVATMLNKSICMYVCVCVCVCVYVCKRVSIAVLSGG
jgi:hypothetical protein